MALQLEHLFQLLPEVEELDQLRLSMIALALPVPEHQWANSTAHWTLERRVLGPAEIQNALTRAESEVQERITTVFAAYREIFEAFLAGRPADGVARLIELGEEEEGASRLGRARAIYETAVRLALPFPDKSLQALALRRVGRVLRSQGELAEALSCYRRSVELAQDTGDVRGEIIGTIGLGTVYGYQAEWGKAEAELRWALRRIEGEPDGYLLERGQVYNNLAAGLTRQNRLPEAEEWFERALELWGRVESPADHAVCYHNLAILRKRQHRTDEALGMYHQALALPVPISYRAIISTDLAQTYAEQGKRAQAREWAREAERSAIAAGSPYMLGHLYYGLGELARTEGEEDGFIFFERALEIARKSSLCLLEGETLIGYGLLRRQSGELDEAKAYLERAREIFQTTGMVHEEGRAAAALNEMVATRPALPAD